MGDDGDNAELTTRYHQQQAQSPEFKPTPYFLPTSFNLTSKMAEEAGVQITKRRTFRTFKYRGYELEKLLELPMEKLTELLPARQRRRFSRGVKGEYQRLLKKLGAAKQNLPYGQKPEPVKTHLRDMVVIPEMIGSIVGVYNGKQYINVEIKPEMVGYYLGEFSITYKPVRHGKPGIGATHSSRFIPLK